MDPMTAARRYRNRRNGLAEVGCGGVLHAPPERGARHAEGRGEKFYSSGMLIFYEARAI
jgi:hypothetical protein